MDRGMGRCVVHCKNGHWSEENIVSYPNFQSTGYQIDQTSSKLTESLLVK